MIYEAIGPIEATAFDLAGAPMVAVAVEGLAHCVDAATFNLLFRPQAEVKRARDEVVVAEAHNHQQANTKGLREYQCDAIGLAIGRLETKKYILGDFPGQEPFVETRPKRVAKRVTREAAR